MAARQMVVRYRTPAAEVRVAALPQWSCPYIYPARQASNPPATAQRHSRIALSGTGERPRDVSMRSSAFPSAASASAYAVRFVPQNRTRSGQTTARLANAPRQPAPDHHECLQLLVYRLAVLANLFQVSFESFHGCTMFRGAFLQLLQRSLLTFQRCTQGILAALDGAQDPLGCRYAGCWRGLGLLRCLG